jgi:hypothetical protein
MKTIRRGAFALFLFANLHIMAQVPQLIHYQGRITVGGTNFDGAGQFKFALVNGGGGATFWSNDGTSVAGSEPTAAVGLTVARGLYAVLLGDVTVPGMTQVIPATVFANPDVRLRVWFNDGVTGFQLLSPDQRIAAVGFAMMSANVPDGVITAAKLADGAVTGPKIAPGAITSDKLGANVVVSSNLADTVALGQTNANGRLDIFRTSANTAAISLVGSTSQISTYGSDGQEQIRLHGTAFGELLLHNSLSNNQVAVNLTANGANGGSLALNNTNGSLRASLSGANSGGLLRLYQADGGIGVYADGDDGGAGSIGIRSTNGANRVFIDGLSTGGGGEISLFDGSGDEVIEVLATSSGGAITLKDELAVTAAILASSASGGGYQYLYNDDGDATVYLDGDSSGGGYISVRNTNGLSRVVIDGQSTAGSGAVFLYDGAGANTISLVGDVSGEGKITTQVLQITGGSDLSESFDVNAIHEALKPGMIVCIDSENPGELVTSSKPYDRTVAGVISGAGGVKPGMLMGQKGTKADGEHPVALTGRVYCYVDADQGAIRPGDLITTSATPGHGMKVGDHAKAHGAIIGKAMTSLESGKGLVLVLVSLQ